MTDEATRKINIKCVNGNENARIAPLEVSVGEYVLVVPRFAKGYTLGQVENVSELGSGDGAREVLILKNSNHLIFKEVLGVPLPHFASRPTPKYSTTHIEEIVQGLPKIIKYLEAAPDSRYQGHADLIKKIAKAKRG